MFYPPLSYKTVLYETHDSREHIFAGNFPNHLHLDSTSAETENTWKSRSPTRSTTFASLLSNSPSGFRDRFPLHKAYRGALFENFESIPRVVMAPEKPFRFVVRPHLSARLAKLPNGKPSEAV